MDFYFWNCLRRRLDLGDLGGSPGRRVLEELMDVFWEPLELVVGRTVTKRR